MKILHIADVQLGAQFKKLGDRAGLQREQLKKTFHKSLEIAVKEGVGAVLIAGDLFDSNHPSHELVEFVRGEMRFLAQNGIFFCVVPGHHDCLDEHGIYNRERFDDEFDNVFIFRDPKGEIKEFDRLNLSVIAKPNTLSTSTESPLPEIFAPTMKYRVIMAHGDLQIPGKSAENYHPIPIATLENIEGVDYVALGHWHSMKDCSGFGKFKIPVWYAGSPELVAVDQVGSGNILLVNFSDQGAQVSPIKVGKRESVAINFDISNFQNTEELKGKILEQAGKDIILEVTLSGMNTNRISFVAENLEEELDGSFFHLRVKDETHLAIKEIPDYSEAFIQGQFLKIMRKKIKEASEGDKKIYKDALQMGLMELEGKEVV